MNEFIDSVEMEDEVEKASLHRRLEIVKFACYVVLLISAFWALMGIIFGYASLLGLFAGRIGIFNCDISDK